LRRLLINSYVIVNFTGGDYAAIGEDWGSPIISSIFLEKTLHTLLNLGLAAMV